MFIYYKISAILCAVKFSAIIRHEGTLFARFFFGPSFKFWLLTNLLVFWPKKGIRMTKQVFDLSLIVL
jgi:hypothetical protein